MNAILINKIKMKFKRPPSLMALTLAFISCTHQMPQSHDPESIVSKTASLIHFELDIPNLEERRFIEDHATWLDTQADRVEEYWKLPHPHKIKLEIKPYETNPDFNNCARTYGSQRIYIHSIQSLKNLTPQQQDKINPYCLKRNMSDTLTTIIHEYSHAVHSLKLKSQTKPLTWIWEGSAVFISTEWRQPEKIRSIITKLKDKEKINICQSDLLNQNPYDLGAVVYAYLDKTIPGGATAITSSETPENFKRTLKKLGLSCVILVKELKESFEARQ